MNVEEALDLVEKVLDYDRLNKVQEIVFRLAWEGQSYSEMAASAGYEPEYIKQVGFQLWQSLSKAFGKKVTKNNFQSILKRYAQHTQVLAIVPTISLTNGHNPEINGLKDVQEFEDETFAKRNTAVSITTRPRQDSGEVIDVSIFYNRTEELALVKQWILKDVCRLVTLFGMGGIDKSALSVKLAQEIHSEFEYFFWRSLRNAPPIQDLLAQLIQFFSKGKETNVPETVDGKVMRVIEYLRSSRCLLVLDNPETILPSAHRQSPRSGNQRQSPTAGDPPAVLAPPAALALCPLPSAFLLECTCMSARDIYHNNVKNALIKDQWTITHDPLSLKFGKKDLYIALGAKQLLAAQKAECKIAVEIKSFTGRSDVDDLEKALGQYVLYQDILTELEPERALYLAVPNSVFDDLFEEPIGKLLLRNRRLRLISFDPKQEVIRQWITPS
jgi:hypothetical protein